MEPLLDEKDRLLEEALLSAGRDVELSPATKARVLAALGVSASLGAATQAAAASGLVSKLLGSKGMALVAISAVTVGAVGAGVYWGVGQSNDQQKDLPVLVVAPPQPVEASPAVPLNQNHERSETKPDSQSGAASETSERNAKSSVEEPAARATKVARKPDVAKDTLGDELALVEAASRATKSGSAGRALTLLDQYRRTFPRGKLALEAEVLRIEALARAGQTTDARRQAKSFLKRHPASPLAARVKRYTQ